MNSISRNAARTELPRQALSLVGPDGLPGLPPLGAAEFYDKLPAPFAAAMPRPAQREKALLWGLDLARRAASWHTFQPLYAEHGIKSVRFAVTSHTLDLIREIETTFGIPRRTVTGMALHFAMVDRFSPHFSSHIATLNSRRR